MQFPLALIRNSLHTGLLKDTAGIKSNYFAYPDYFCGGAHFLGLMGTGLIGNSD